MKRGFTYLEAIDYVGVKRRTFDTQWRPHLVAMSQGTSLIFDREDLDSSSTSSSRTRGAAFRHRLPTHFKRSPQRLPPRTFPIRNLLRRYPRWRTGGPRRRKELKDGSSKRRLPRRKGQVAVDKLHRGERLQGRFGSHQEAEAWLIAKCAEIDAYGPVGARSMTLAEAATRYLLEEERAGKPSLSTESYLLEPVVECVGHLQLDQVHDGTLRPFVDKRLAEGRSHKTVNLSLGVVRHMLNRACRKWRVDVGGGRTVPVLLQVPLLTMLSLNGHQRDPQPISWDEQRRLMPLLPAHLARMSLFTVNTGARDNVVVNLRWAWESQVDLGDFQCSVFEVPKQYVKGRKSEGYVVCNSVAQAIVEQARGQHGEFVFVWRRERVKNFDKKPAMQYQPIESMNNTAWQTARRKAGLGDLHVHDLRHTVGMRLREAGVKEDTRSDNLWHVRPGMTAHYSEAQIREIRTALELIKDETGRQNRSLRSLAKEARKGLALNERVPSGSLQQEKTP